MLKVRKLKLRETMHMPLDLCVKRMHGILQQLEDIVEFYLQTIMHLYGKDYMKQLIQVFTNQKALVLSA